MGDAKILLPYDEIRSFCQRWDLEEFALFGSILQENFSADSDVDVLVTFSPNSEIGLFDMAQMQIELQEIFNRNVDVVEKDALRNPYRKREIINTAQVIYAA